MCICFIQCDSKNNACKASLLTWTAKENSEILLDEEVSNIHALSGAKFEISGVVCFHQSLGNKLWRELRDGRGLDARSRALNKTS